jgi:hypothetical protein
MSPKKIKQQMLVIGSGFHSQVLGAKAGLLASWTELLDEIALEVGLKPSIYAVSQPTTAWEQLLSDFSKKKQQRHQKAHIAEERLKRVTRDIIIREENKRARSYKENAFNVLLKSRLALGGIHLLSLNFDQLIYRDIEDSLYIDRKFKHKSFYGKLTDLRSDDLDLIYNRELIERKNNINSYIWHPHGSVKKYKSLRLGLRDYAIMPGSYVYAFNKFKAWERSLLKRNSMNKTNEPLSASDHKILLDRIQEWDSGKIHKKELHADNWVTRFMLLPVRFIGVGLSVEEIGLRWLINQRQRNLSRINKHDSQIIYTRMKKPELIPWGCVIQDFESWDSAWTNTFI